VTEGKLSLTEPVVFVGAAKDDVPTAAFIHAEDLAELGAPTTNAERFYGTEMLLECASLLSRGKHLSPSNPNIFENVVTTYLAKCKGVRQLFVIRTRERSTRDFVGDLLAYDLATGNYLGGFPLEVHSEGRRSLRTETSRSVERRPSSPGRARYRIVESARQVVVNDDLAQLRVDASDVIDEGLNQHIPNLTFIE
jgi:hypothetical protein